MQVKLPVVAAVAAAAGNPTATPSSNTFANTSNYATRQRVGCF
jgi:hypothetical protein